MKAQDTRLILHLPKGSAFLTSLCPTTSKHVLSKHELKSDIAENNFSETPPKHFTVFFSHVCHGQRVYAWSATIIQLWFFVTCQFEHLHYIKEKTSGAFIS